MQCALAQATKDVTLLHLHRRYVCSKGGQRDNGFDSDMKEEPLCGSAGRDL